MPVFKYRSVEEMPPLPVATEETLVARIRAVWSRATRLAEPCFTRGVQKFRNLEEANEARQRELQRRAMTLRALTTSGDR